MTLGCLLAPSLGIELRRVGSGNRYTFGPGERVLSDGMQDNALVCWAETAEPWIAEHVLIQELDLPLNLDQNGHHAFATQLSTMRRACRARAKGLPIRSDW